MDKEIDLAILLRDFIPKSFQLVVESKIDDKRVKTLSALDQLIDPVEEFVVLGTDPNRSTVQVRGLGNCPPDTVLVRNVQHQALLSCEKHIGDYTGLGRKRSGLLDLNGNLGQLKAKKRRPSSRPAAPNTLSRLRLALGKPYWSLFDDLLVLSETEMSGLRESWIVSKELKRRSHTSRIGPTKTWPRFVRVPKMYNRSNGQVAEWTKAPAC